jgi:peroxiredoxin
MTITPVMKKFSNVMKRWLSSPKVYLTRYLALPMTTLAMAGMLTGCQPSSEFAGSAPESTFVLLDGSKQTTAQLKGRVTLVNFWATSCTTCVAEMPQVIATYNKFHLQGFDVLAVAMSYDPPSYVVNYTETRKLPFKVAIDNTGAVAKAWGDVKLTPTTYIVNKRGEIVKRYVGAPDFEALHTLIAQLLAEKA